MTEHILSIRNGYWCKRIRVEGDEKYTDFYFGSADIIPYEEAAARYYFELPFLKTGMPVPDPNQDDDVKTVGDLTKAFMESKRHALETGQLSEETLEDYDMLCELIVDIFGHSRPLTTLQIIDFERLRHKVEVGKKGQVVSPNSINRNLGSIRTIFKFATDDNRLIDRNFPLQTALKMVPKRTLRKHRDDQPDRLLTRDEILAIIQRNTNQTYSKYRSAIMFRAMVLLGINGGYNNSDVAKLELERVKPEPPEIFEYRRRKTWYERATPLWPETREAISEYMEIRPACPSKQLFVSSRGNDFLGIDRKSQITNLFNYRFKLVNKWEPGKNFGALRTTFANIGKEVGDDVALKALMGHDDGSTLYTSYAIGQYVPRLLKITDHVHQWLFQGT